jgi:protein-disulfide isomerase
MQKTDIALLAVSVVALVTTIGGAAGPEGAIGRRVIEWRAQQQQRTTLRGAWTTMAETGRLGAADGRLWLVEFGDYQCPYCRAVHAELRQFMQLHPEAGVAYKQLPLTAIHPVALDASRAATCAEQQGAFQGVHDFLFESDEWMEDKNWHSVGVAGGVPRVEEFVRCIDTAATDSLIAVDQQLAAELRIESTPTFAVGDQVVAGSVSLEVLQELWQASERF